MIDIDSSSLNLAVDDFNGNIMDAKRKKSDGFDEIEPHR